VGTRVAQSGRPREIARDLSGIPVTSFSYYPTFRRTVRTQVIAESQSNRVFALADIHVSLLSRKNTRGQARLGERAQRDLERASLQGASRRWFAEPDIHSLSRADKAVTED
jgi:hypothetical protein